MPTKTNNKRARLNVEYLEDRTVPTYFGASGGESIAVGAVLQIPGILEATDSPDDVITGTGPGVPGLVTIVNSNDKIIQQFYPFGQSFKGGVYVATGDVTGDGQTDLICSTGVGTVGTVNVYEFINGGPQLISSITPFGPNYSSGIDIAVGNVTGQVYSTFFDAGVANQIIVGMAHGGSTVEVYGYDDSSGMPQYYQLRSFRAFAPSYTGGVTLAAAELYTAGTDDYASIITGMATTMPQVAIWNGQNPIVTQQADYLAWNTAVASNRNGVNVAANDTDHLRGAQIFVNLRGTGSIRVFEGVSSAILTTLSTYPPSYASMVNMSASGGVSFFGANSPPADDQLTGFDYTRDLFVVSATAEVNQVPVYFSGGLFVPAGFNGSKAL
jgi:hypothetical protein